MSFTSCLVDWISDGTDIGFQVFDVVVDIEGRSIGLVTTSSS